MAGVIVEQSHPRRNTWQLIELSGLPTDHTSG
jgi:hypothetical protein